MIPTARFITVSLTLLVAMSVASETFAGPLSVKPDSVSLSDPFARRQLLIEADGRDVTREAKFVSSQPTIATVDDAGYVTPIADGSTEISVSVGGVTSKIPVKVSGTANGRSVDFSTEIVPLLSRFGCNAGGCHGKQNGQNGFQLSLFGFDTEFDYSALVKEARGRSEERRVGKECA